MKKRICLCAVSLFSIIGFNTAKAQITTALSANNNYTGIMSSLLNPAAPANSRVGFEFNLLTMQAGLANDAYQTSFSNLFKSSLYSGNATKGVDYFATTNTKDKNLSTNLDLLGPSFQLSLSNNSSVTVYSRFRNIINASGVNGAVMDIAENEFRNNFAYQLGSPNFSMHAFGEIALSYAHAFTKNPQHAFKVGLTGKYVVGAGALVNRMDNATVEYDNTGDKFTTLQAKTHTLFSTGLTAINLNDPNIDNIFNDITNSLFKSSGVGADIGFQYEYRPEGRAFDYKTDKGRFSRHDNPYMFKLGVSLLDVGAISYAAGDRSGDYTITANNQFTSVFTPQANETVQQYIDRLKTANIVAINPISTFTMSLPTTLNINADYHPLGNLYVGAGAMINVIDKKSSSKDATYYESVYQLTPRLESRQFTLFVPMSFDVVRQFTAGVGVQLGPLTLGSSSILSNLANSKKIRTIDFFAGLSYRFYKKRYNLAKPIVLHDTTIIQQHTTDTLLVTKDRDGDGIVDDKDECPDVPGLLALNGCPDQDGDGIPDYKDSCVTVPGVAKYNGCPIPDRDGDGINDDEDKCPDVPGLARYQGCPITDRDNDGVNDEEDKCPDVPGTVANFGCPEIKADVIEKFKKAAGKIYFATGKFTVLAKSFPALNIVVAELKKDSTLRLEIQGHTDNVGKPANNMILSDKRAASVKAYLVKKGIDPTRLKSHGYGDSKPVQPNKTAAGRAKNRRTEFNLSNYDAPTDAPVTQ